MLELLEIQTPATVGLLSSLDVYMLSVPCPQPRDEKRSILREICIVHSGIVHSINTWEPEDTLMGTMLFGRRNLLQ